MNDLLALAVIGAIVGVSVLTYRWVEVPGRDWVNGWLARRTAAAKARAGSVAVAPGG